MADTYKVIYNGNGATGGTAPVDSTSYGLSDIITILNQNTLVHNIYYFKAWLGPDNKLYLPDEKVSVDSLKEVATAAKEFIFKAVWAPDEKYRLSHSGEQVDEAVQKVLDLQVDSATLNQLDGLLVNSNTLNKLEGLTVNASAINMLDGIKTDQTVQTQINSKVEVNSLKSVGSETQPVYFDANGVPQPVDLSQPSGMANYATYAYNDENGENIVNTYQRKNSAGRNKFTLTPAGWSGNKYSFESIYPHSLYNITVELDGDLTTLAEYKAWSKAFVVGSPSESAIKALKKVPEIDLHILLTGTLA